MANKVIIGILVLLLVINAAIGTYAYLLSRDIDTLSRQITEQKEELTSQLGVMSDEVEALGSQTEARFDTVESGIQSNLAGINTLGNEIAEETALTESKIAGLEAGISDIRNELAETGPVLNADEVYQAVSRSVVEVSDGEHTIGSGFVYDNDGHVVTANHVIDELTTIYVVFPDGRTTPASVVGSCPISDVAVINLERQIDITPLTLADSASISIGEPAVTIGSPFDEGGTITAGIVSQLGRFEEVGDETESNWIANLIQFDAPVNFGNSGGPLFNAAGEVIGIIVARIEPEIGDGIAYAVSANKVRRVADTIIEQGFFDYPWLGVEASDITPLLAEVLGRESVHGALVVQVTPGGPANLAGVLSDDIIIAINSAVITEIADLVSYLGEHGSPGDLVVLTIIRDDVEIELTATLSNR
jgi:S1-C subfamily serine protease